MNTDAETGWARASRLEMENKQLRDALKSLKGRERLTGQDHKTLGFHVYNGPQNPYSIPLTIAELLLEEEAVVPKYSPRKILQEVFARLAEYEDVLGSLGEHDIVCEHVNITKYHDNSILCTDCYKVIWQGKDHLEPHPLEIKEKLERPRKGRGK